MIKEIMDAIIPENILKEKLISDGIDIFVDELLDKSSISIDISNIYSEDNPVLYEELVKIYLNNIYTLLSNTQYNEKIYTRLTETYAAVGQDFETDVVQKDVIEYLTRDYIITNKAYKNAKGTKKSIEYIYNVIINSGIQGPLYNSDEFPFTFTEGANPFEFEVEGSLIPEVYEQFVKPLAHPLGWSYIYRRVMQKTFTEYFDVEFEYVFSYFQVRTKFGDIFKTDDYLTNLDSEGAPLVVDNTVELITEESAGLYKVTTILFASGEYLVSSTHPISTILYDSDDTVLKDYDALGNSALYISYTATSATTVLDEFTPEMDHSFNCSPSTYLVVGAPGLKVDGSWKIGDTHNPETYGTDVNVDYVKGAFCKEDFLFEFTDHT